MSDPATTLRLRRLPRRGIGLQLLIGICVTLVINLVILLLLGEVLQHRRAVPTLATRPGPRVVDQPPPPPPPTLPRQQAQARALAAELPALPELSVALPAPAMPQLGGLTLPTPSDVPRLALGGLAEHHLGEPAVVATPIAVDEPPRLLGLPDLGLYYPRQARRRGVTGQTKVELTVDAQGAITSVTILSSDPEGVFEDAARRALASQQVRLDPARSGGQAVAGRLVVNLKWTLR